MRCHLMSLGCKIWIFVEKGYKTPDNLPTGRDEQDEYGSNAKALNAILKGLAYLVFVKFMQCKTTKETWKKLKTIYEGDTKSNNKSFKHARDVSKSKDERRIKYCRISSKSR